MTNPNEPLLLDTNVLICALDGSSPNHVASRAVLDRALSINANICVTPQNLAEFYSLVTNPRRVSSPRTPSDALAALESMISLPGLEVLPVPIDVVQRWIELARRRAVSGPDIYDVQIVAVMLANSVHRICTYNTSDFIPFAEIKVETP